MISVKIDIRSATKKINDQDHESCTASSQDLENDRIEFFILSRRTDFPEPHFAYNPEIQFLRLTESEIQKPYFYNEKN